MRLSFATWNVNSVRLRMPQIQAFLAQTEIDILCLQEIKCQEHEFPYDAFRALGFEHIHVAGQKGWHGVAIVSKVPFESGDLLPFCRRGEARAQAIRVDNVDIWNFYIPAGGDVPDRTTNDKFDHKLEFYERLCTHLAQRNRDHPLLICGDLNIAPGEFDVWSHRQMLRVVSHTPLEIEAFGNFMACGDFHDPFRVAYPEPQKIFTWWSYRASDYRASNRGLRLDHVLLNPALMARVANLTAKIHDDVRGWTQPSDHVPAQVTFEI
ncbi:exodeoxyribonuclease III [Asticcacaulis biprosthecium C19]|uniref:Exodeoxyribonuclease III n=1 Tax=Asticcacaulis biprosthecium C19 TaxID=715226 RepID=F4QK08_9CAUL|nr:exodeoxyribonuclease III [Asticcacaulis biprosthecium]EGF92035.1 exodeoxyribonuclease III [Asticcacaulis biprosthecium C19]